MWHPQELSQVAQLAFHSDSLPLPWGSTSCPWVQQEGGRERGREGRVAGLVTAQGDRPWCPSLVPCSLRHLERPQAKPGLSPKASRGPAGHYSLNEAPLMRPFSSCSHYQATTLFHTLAVTKSTEWLL
jgi:hypothetical protein